MRVCADGVDHVKFEGDFMGVSWLDNAAGFQNGVASEMPNFMGEKTPDDVSKKKTYMLLRYSLPVLFRNGTGFRIL